MERFNFIFGVAGVFFFVLAFAIMGALPIAQYMDVDVVEIDELAQDVPYQFEQLAETYPDEFTEAFGTSEPTPEAFAEALRAGKKTYIAEACWHCHSQQVRRVDPNNKDEVGHDISRWASDTNSESISDEYYNEMNYPHLFGTRRVGPDLIRQSGRHSNDWHVAHFWNPRDTSPYSVMPRYPWFFADDEGLVLNKTGLSMIAYMQWLGSWHTQFNTEGVEEVADIGITEAWYPEQEYEAEPADQGGDQYGDEYDGYGAEEDY